MEFKELIVSKVKEKFGSDIVDITDFRNDLCIEIHPARIVELSNFLKDDPELDFAMCVDVTAIDWAKRKNRFTAVYHLYSLSKNFNIRLKATIEDAKNPSIDSVVSVWESANWYERETWDMYGIHFNNHPDLRRMYMPETFEYHPLRKEFPVMGIPGSLPLPNKNED
ncbi:MAG: NADH-quinone oxidoreductase subunit C [Melioribacteraceae bacterium]|nr:MAG: NADH-quinone oxidoreductase subunit C [Melioribacteraceae bacterium]